MSCSWSSHSCISESKLSISSGLSCPQPRPLCSSPRSRSMAAMTQATQYPRAFINGNFPFLLFHFPVKRSQWGCWRGMEGSMAWKHYKDKYMEERKKGVINDWFTFLRTKWILLSAFFHLCVSMSFNPKSGFEIKQINIFATFLQRWTIRFNFFKHGYRIYYCISGN